MVLFIIGNLLAANANSYLALMVARLITSLNHGAFFGIGSVVAASLVPWHTQASAVAAMFMGLTLANLIGVPTITWVGQQYGWKAAFALISGLGFITVAGLLWLLPTMPMGNKLNIIHEIKVLTRLPVILALLTTVFGAGAMFVLYTYIAPFLINMTHVEPQSVAFLLVIVGVGFTLGNYLGGKLSDYSIDKTLTLFLVVLIASMLLLPLVSSHFGGTMAIILVWSVASFGLVPPLQTKTMQIAYEAPSLVSSINVGAFNLGNAIGAVIGGYALQYGYNMVPIGGAIVASVGLFLLVLQKYTTKPL
jgi:DHA1 family inner membrane transport protein